jgi:hypothetical protein
MEGTAIPEFDGKSSETDYDSLGILWCKHSKVDTHTRKSQRRQGASRRSKDCEVHRQHIVEPH